MILSSLTTGQRFSTMGWIQSYRLTVAFLFSVITALILSERFTKHPPRLLVWSFAFFLSRVLAKGVIQGGSRDDILTVLDGKHSSMTRWECVVNLKAQYLHRHFWTRHPSLTPTILNGNQCAGVLYNHAWCIYIWEVWVYSWGQYHTFMVCFYLCLQWIALWEQSTVICQTVIKDAIAYRREVY